VRSADNDATPEQLLTAVDELLRGWLNEPQKAQTGTAAT
jgi:hypothetical protein